MAFFAHDHEANDANATGDLLNNSNIADDYLDDSSMAGDYVDDSSIADSRIGLHSSLAGMFCQKKDLYQHLDGYETPTWVDTFPVDLIDAAEGEETEKYAIIVRYKKSGDSRKSLEVDSIVIQSPLLKDVFRRVLKDYPGVTPTLSRLVFAAPFQPFLHRWDELVAARKNELDPITKKHLSLLITELEGELDDSITALKDSKRDGVVMFYYIWTVFEPGCILYTRQSNEPVAVRLIDGQFTKHHEYGVCFKLKCSLVDYDGVRFGYSTVMIYLTTFEGTKAITDLEAFPIHYHPKEKSLMKELIARGRRFEMLAGYHYKSYGGYATHINKIGFKSTMTIRGRIIIDTDAFRKENPDSTPELRSLDRVDTNSQNDKVNEFDPSNYWNRRAVPPELLVTPDPAQNCRRPLTEEELILCAPVVRGYAMREKVWCEFSVDLVGEIVFNNGAFDSLVLPEGHKSMILAIAQSQAKNKNVFDDVIGGKGQGIIMLLSGGPGIGKTLTAESIAEHMRVPLYTISASDFGTDARDVEEGLMKVLAMVTKWNAVLVLDECDVFLEARSKHDLHRNHIVSIFLRMLEYYEGFLFLTTNRVEHMDEAFNSRIHFHLAYPDLDEAARRTVWKGFLSRQLGDHDVSEEDLEKLQKLEINGRVIKNILRSAVLLSSHQNEKLGFKHLRIVLQIDGYEV